MNTSIHPPEAASLSHVCRRDSPLEKKKISDITFKSQNTSRAVFEKVEWKAIFQAVALREEDHRRRLTPALFFLKVNEQLLLSSDKGCNSVEESCQYPSSEVQFISQSYKKLRHMSTDLASLA